MMRLMTNRSPWVWRRPNWPHLTYSASDAAADLAETYRMHGVLEGKAAALGLGATSQVALDAMADEVMATAAIEGEQLSADAVRSSVMRRLGLAASGSTNRHVDGLVDVINDATTAIDQPLDEDRLCRWQSALFPGGTSGILQIAVGRYRDHDDPMPIVSGPPGQEVVHYVAPASKDVPAQMAHFLQWFADSKRVRNGASASQDNAVDGLARAAIAQVWFESIHPFEDGNGRIGRAIVDMALAQHFRQPVRLYSLSRQLKTARSGYYDALNQAQRGDTDVTKWVQWFAGQCTAACLVASQVIDQAIEKKRFWDQGRAADLSDRHRKVLQRLLDAGDGGFEGGLNAEKFIKMTAMTKATATRDLGDLVDRGLLRKQGEGKAVRYYVDMAGWSHGLPPAPAPAVADSREMLVDDGTRSDAGMRRTLEAPGFTDIEYSGEWDRPYFGSVKAVSASHMGQGLGRGKAVIDDVRTLSAIPKVGANLEVHFRSGRGTVVEVAPHEREQDEGCDQ